MANTIHFREFAVDPLDNAAIDVAIRMRRALPLAEYDGQDERGAILAEVCRGYLEMIGRLDAYHAELRARGIRVEVEV